MARHAEQLELRVQERTAHLHQALSSLESVLYHIAHDLRGPLRIMHAFSNMLVADYGERMDGPGRDYARRISGAASRMDQMLHSLVEYGQVCHLEMIPTRVTVEHVLKGVLSHFAGRIDASEARMKSSAH